MTLVEYLEKRREVEQVDPKLRQQAEQLAEKVMKLQVGKRPFPTKDQMWDLTLEEAKKIE